MGAELQGFQGNSVLKFIFYLYFAYENIVKIIYHGTTQLNIMKCSFKVNCFLKNPSCINQVKAKRQASIITLNFSENSSITRLMEFWSSVGFS